MPVWPSCVDDSDHGLALQNIEDEAARPSCSAPTFFTCARSKHVVPRPSARHDPLAHGAGRAAPYPHDPLAVCPLIEYYMHKPPHSDLPSHAAAVECSRRTVHTNEHPSTFDKHPPRVPLRRPSRWPSRRAVAGPFGGQRGNRTWALPVKVLPLRSIFQHASSARSVRRHA